MRPAWQPDFDFYETHFEEIPAIVFLDLGAKAHAPVKTHPLRLLVRVKMLDPLENGLRAREEADSLFAVEDAIVERVIAGLEALYVGRLIAEGFVTFAFFLPEKNAAKVETLSAIVGNVTPYVAQWRCEEDPAWAYYADLLYPDEKALAEMKSRRATDRILGVGEHRS